MKITNNSNKYDLLRKKYDYFIYEKYSIIRNINSFAITFVFNLADKFYFYPKIEIPKKSFYLFDSLSDYSLRNIIFHIGMIELISYWKCVCPPKIIIKPHYLNKEQINWWKKLYFNGLGEFFYLNSINTNINDFTEIIVNSDDKLKPSGSCLTDDSTIIPVGGGKDSVVTLELLSKKSNNNLCLILNPREASLQTSEIAGYSAKNTIEIWRTIDPKLLELNEKGFLNGHTPFSALLAFVTVLSAIITNKKNIVLSNESSANESTIRLRQTNINHQYSKSFTFEKDFRFYVNKYISKDINYYSFLRPLSELQIAKLFSKFPKYFFCFKSCNKGSKTDIWCGKCPKCMFTFIILSPFISQQKLELIFGKNLFDDADLLHYFNQLIGKENRKPFECIGTVEEVNIALCMTIAKEDKKNLPYLLKYYTGLDNYKKYKYKSPENLLNRFHSKHFLSSDLKKLLMTQIS